MGGRGYSSATSRRATAVAAPRTATFKVVSGSQGMKVSGIPDYAVDALKAWGSDNESESFRDIIASQMGAGGNATSAAHAAALERAVSNHPYRADIWRGLAMSEKDIKALREGGELATHNRRGALSSWSKGTAAPFEFATANSYAKGGVPVLMVMKGGTKHGRSITDFVDATDPARSFEQEVLVSGRSKLWVDAITKTRLAGITDGYIIEVVER